MTIPVRGIRRWIFIIFLGSTLPVWSYQGTNYSDNLNDIRTPKFANYWQGQPFDPVPIGNLGPIGAVADLRGFVPMVFESDDATPGPFRLRLNLVQARWYKIPTRKALLMLYYGKLKYSQLAADVPKELNQPLESTRFLDEYHSLKEKGDLGLWCKMAYAMEKDSKALLQRLSGGYDSIEPILVFVTKDSAFVIVNLGYSDLARMKGTGQVLVAMEFSRALRQYKTFYTLYSTTIFSPGVRQFLAEYGPAMARTVATIAMEAWWKSQ